MNDDPTTPSQTASTRKIELLAPAGDEASLEAAIRSGADAVYFGLENFSARSRAANFSIQALPATVQRLHRFGTKAYVALNTLVTDTELASVETAARACAEAGADAVIVQDLGVLAMVRECAPGLTVHASTQMTCTDEAAIRLAESLGVSRVVLPRELSLQDIARIRAATTLELEVFVHGALCVSFSGQCLASLSMGGRSANRGACAQPCRLPYDLVLNGVVQPAGAKPFVMSPMDLDASAVVGRLLDVGVDALKIEGRMKRPEYVAAAVRLYRGQIGAWRNGNAEAPPDALCRETALQMFSRGSGTGFLEGIDHQQLVEGTTSDHRGVLVGTVQELRTAGRSTQIVVRTAASLARGDGLLVEGQGSEEECGGRVWDLRVDGHSVELADPGTEVSIGLGPGRTLVPSMRGRRVFRTSAPRLETQLQAALRDAPARLGVAMVASGAAGTPLTLNARTADGRSASVESAVPLVAANHRPLDRAVLEDKLGKLGDTPFELTSLQIALQGDVILPLSSVNQTRRALVEALESATMPQPLRDRKPARIEGPLPTPLEPAIVVLCRTEAQSLAAFRAGAQAFVLDLPSLRESESAMRQLRAFGPSVWIALATLQVRKPGEAALEDALVRAGPDGLLLRSLASLAQLQSGWTEIAGVADTTLNVANARAARVVLGLGARAFTPCWDADDASLTSMLAGELVPYGELVVHGPRGMFHTQHCLFAANLSDGRDRSSCGRPCERVHLALRDRSGSVHPVLYDRACRNTVASRGIPGWQGRIRTAQRLGVRRLRVELLDESPEETDIIVRDVIRLAHSTQP